MTESIREHTPERSIWWRFLRYALRRAPNSVLYAAVWLPVLACTQGTEPGRSGVTGQPTAAPMMKPPQSGGSGTGAGGLFGGDNPLAGNGGIVTIVDAGTPDAASCIKCDPAGGQYCGTIGDGCGGMLECGECKTKGWSCGVRDIDNVCGAPLDSGACTPTVCEQPTGKYCGKVGDGCGAAIDCGECSGSQTCGGRGTPNLCGTPQTSPDCTPYTCTAGDAQYCGKIGDGCGGEIDCGACSTAGHECGARIERLCGTPCPLCKQVQACSNGGTTIVRGVAVAGALMMPDTLYNAQVFIPNIAPGAKLEPLKDGPTCDRCTPLTLDNSLASAITGPDGAFELRDVPAGMGIPIVVQLGGWRMQTSIDVMPCVENNLAPGTVRLPRNRNEGDIPLTAIATGDVDRLQCLLRKLGIEDTEFGNPGGQQRIQFFVSNGSTIDATTPLADDLSGAFNGPGKWSNYTQVLLPCEGGEVLKGAAAQMNMLNYVNKGGRVFATHFSYTWLFQNGALATTGTWAPNLLPMTMTTLIGNIDTSFKKGQDFAKWLELAGALSSVMPPQVSISEPRSDLTAVPDMAGGRRWLYSDMPPSVQQYTVDTPVLAPPDKTCGRVVYSDFHVLNARTRGMIFPAECDTMPLTPQEKVLAFMLFDLASCIGTNAPPAPPPPPPPPPPAAPPPPLPPPPVF